MKKIYELTLLTHPELKKELECNLNENSIERELIKIEDKIKEFGVEIISVEYEGKKRLAYAIQGNEWAYYIYIELLVKDSDAVQKIANYLNINDSVLRYLLVETENRYLETNATTDFMTKTIKDWVVKMFGESEAEDPSWNIDALAREISGKMRDLVYDVENEYFEEYNGEDKFYIFGKNLIETIHKKLNDKMKGE